MKSELVMFMENPDVVSITVMVLPEELILWPLNRHLLTLTPLDLQGLEELDSAIRVGS